MTDTMADLLVPGDACKYLGVSRRTLERLTSAGYIPEIRLSERVVRYSRTDLDAYIHQAREAGHARAREAADVEESSRPRRRGRGRPRKEEEVRRARRQRR